jgi:hypothetical protein
MSVSARAGGVRPADSGRRAHRAGRAGALAVARRTGHGLPDPAHRRRRGRVWAFAIAMALFSNALPFFLLAWGQQHVASGFAGITMAAVPLFVLGLAHVFVPGERLTPPARGGLRARADRRGLLIGGEALRAPAAELRISRGWPAWARRPAMRSGSIVTRRAPPILAGVLQRRRAAGGRGDDRAGGADARRAARLPAAERSRDPRLLYLGLGPTALATLILVRVIRSAPGRGSCHRSTTMCRSGR